MYKVPPSAKKAVSESSGYVVFSNFGTKIFVIGGGAGKGIVFDQKAKKETFIKMIEAQAGLGRPKNPDFLLRSGELAQHFADWDRLHSFEGISHNDAGQPVAIAQLVARKPTG